MQRTTRPLLGIGRLSLALLAIAVQLAALAPASGETAAFLTPDGSTYPFEDWSREDANSTFAFYEEFFTITDAEPNSSFAPGLAAPTLSETTGAGSTTSSRNIYSPTAVLEFEAATPSYALGQGYDTRVAVQIGTLGSLVDQATVMLSYESSSGPVTVGPTAQQELAMIEIVGGFGGDLQEVLYVWDLPGWNAGEYTLTFAGAETSVSLDNLAIDIFTQGGAAAPGDFNNDGALDADDYQLWAGQYGGPGPEADANADGVVDAADYTVWRDALASAPASAATAAPEPSSLAMAGLFGLTIVFCSGVHWSIAPRSPRRNS